ncbi:MAG TPA: nuclear transport factor 2 family protein [Acidimicrobiia bacterium]|nr:nuclear transport factor 2 family protein [Acidimicrobiia bacterium]
MKFTELMRIYCDDYTTQGDLTVVPSIIHPSYRFTMSGSTLDYDRYLAMVESALGDHFPDLGLVVHDLFADDDRIALRFSEHATWTNGNRAVWMGISMYRRAGDGRLSECLVEQDFYGRRQQLSSGVADPLPAAMDDPWSTAVAAEEPDAVAVARAWALKAPLPAPVRAEDVVIEDAFGSGRKVALRLRIDGTYRGGLFGIPDEAVGAPCWIHVNTISHVGDGRVTDSWAVSDRFGLRNRLKEAT